jgi:molybdopterin molybdotransferase
VSELKTIVDALADVLAAAPARAIEEIGLTEALGRTAARDVASRDDVPGYANSAMDGFAVRSADLGLAGRTGLRVVADIPAGTVYDKPLGAGEAARIMTGGPLPEGADTVVQVEHTRTEGDVVIVMQAPDAGAHVRPAGEDLRRGGTVVRAGRVLRAADLGLLAAAGVAKVPVARRPRVAIIATGSELVPPEEPVGPGLIRNSNSFTAYGQVVEAGAEPVMLGVARDDPQVTREMLARALDEDIVVTSGGVSVGDYDFVKSVQEELGVERRFWGVKIKPGKPLAFGVRGRTLVFGVPGNPVSAMTSFEVFIRPAILTMLGRPDIWRPWVMAETRESLRRCKDRAELRRCRLEMNAAAGEEPAGRPRFTLTGAQGSGLLSSMTLADGLLLLPAAFPGAAPGDQVPVMFLEGSASERPPFPS